MPKELSNSAKPQILIVDDDPDIRVILTEVVSQMGAIALEAGKATDAIIQMEKYRVDLLLLDIQMQGASGIDLLKVMRRRHLQIPTIIISGLISGEMAADLAQLGVTGIVAKPFTPTRIGQEIKKVLGHT